MQLIRSNPVSPTTLDELFVLKYEWLMRWALHFAQGDQTTAEDLVQDTFVRFAVTHPELDDAENVTHLHWFLRPRRDPLKAHWWSVVHRSRRAGK